MQYPCSNDSLRRRSLPRAQQKMRVQRPTMNTFADQALIAVSTNSKAGRLTPKFGERRKPLEPRQQKMFWLQDGRLQWRGGDADCIAIRIRTKGHEIDPYSRLIPARLRTCNRCRKSSCALLQRR
jgi:hypothetical protein